MSEHDVIKFKPSGRCAEIIYQSGDNTLKIYCEMSGVPEHDILLAPLNLKEWDKPKGEEIDHSKQNDIFITLRTWLKENNFKTDIDSLEDMSTDSGNCLWKDCSNQKLKGRAYCNFHWDENLIKR